jgi:hypothetical protein
MQNIAQKVERSTEIGQVPVTLTNQLVSLLSDQLYQSPIKALEEMVVNSFDAMATECRISLPTDRNDAPDFIAVFDDGEGMDADGLFDLWLIGSSKKRDGAKPRKQIGKFGIGKLATYALARKVTWLTRRQGVTRAVTIDYAAFSSLGPSNVKPISLAIRRIDDDVFVAEPYKGVFERLGVLESAFRQYETWTLVVLEDIKQDKWSQLRVGRLKWVLRTAMPLMSTFRLFLGGVEIGSSKAVVAPIIDFSVSELPTSRLAVLRKVLEETVDIVAESLVTPSFPSGISGRVRVYRKTLEGKSDDLGRSGGFFVRVNNRLINEDDPLFGLTPRSHQVFNRFRADLDADDLDAIITAPREGVGSTPLRARFQIVLRELFNEARDRYVAWLDKLNKSQRFKPETDRNRVRAELVHFPVADALAAGDLEEGADADRSWFYLDLPNEHDRDEVLRTLYASDEGTPYRYAYANTGREARMLRFAPAERTFVLNLDHEFVAAYIENGYSKAALEDIATAEALLEVYLWESHVASATTGQILERRDALLRSLVRDHPVSTTLIADTLRGARDDERDLEMALVSAARAIGFVAKHIGGADEPDGVGRYSDYPGGERVITLEAKSSKGTPTLSQLDFATLAKHREAYDAQAVLLIAPRYPGLDEEAAVPTMARQQRISCWTVDDLAAVTSAVERRQITAQEILDIVLSTFPPAEVHAKVQALLQSPEWDVRDLYEGILSVLRDLHGRLPDASRSVGLIAGRLLDIPALRNVREADVRKALSEMAAASQGFAHFSGDSIVIYGGLEEFSRRVSFLVSSPKLHRGHGSFRETI